MMRMVLLTNSAKMKSDSASSMKVFYAAVNGIDRRPVPNRLPLLPNLVRAST